MVEAIKTGLGGFLQRTQPKPIRFSLNLCTQMSTFAPPSSFNLTQGIVWLLVVFCNLFKVSVHPQTHTHSSIHKLKLNYSIEIWKWGKSKTRDTMMYFPKFRSPLDPMPPLWNPWANTHSQASSNLVCFTHFSRSISWHFPFSGQDRSLHKFSRATVQTGCSLAVTPSHLGAKLQE